MFRSIRKPLAVAAAVGAMTLGSYGIANAASGNSITSASAPWGQQRSDETLLTGDTLAKVQAAAVGKAGSGATVVRVETDADGHAAYEAHMVKADGTPVTVYVNSSFDVVGVESR